MATNITGGFGLSLDLSTTGTYVSNVSATGWNLSIGTLTVTLGSFLTISAAGLKLDPTATGSQNFLSLADASTELKVGSFTSRVRPRISPSRATVTLSAVSPGTPSASASRLDRSGTGTALVPTGHQRHHEYHLAARSRHPYRHRLGTFQLVTSFDIKASIAGLDLEGSVKNLTIDVGMIGTGNPIVSFDSISASVSGDLFGATVSGTFFAGLAQDNTTTPSQNVFYCGVEGSLDLADSLNVTIRLGLSDRGPLDVYIEAGSAEGIPLGDTSLYVSKLYGSVDFNAAPLPSITDPRQLAGPAFVPQEALTQQQWEQNLSQQVLRQIHGNDGFLFALSTATTTDLNNHTAPDAGPARRIS